MHSKNMDKIITRIAELLEENCQGYTVNDIEIMNIKELTNVVKEVYDQEDFFSLSDELEGNLEDYDFEGNIDIEMLEDIRSKWIEIKEEK